MNAQMLMGQLEPFGNRTKMLVSEQSTSDIIQAILKAHKEHAKDYAKIAPSFNAGTRREIGSKIFDFLKNNIRYRIEPSSRQTVKSPSAILAQGYGDCKHYSLFAGGVLENLGVPFAYRFASYKLFDKSPQHVFVVINPGTENEIWVDPVLPSFDQKKPYTYAIDKKMAIYSISGVQNNQINGLKSIVKKVAKKAGTVLKKGARFILKLSIAPMRNAFLVLVKLNVGGLGDKFEKAWAKSPSKVQNFWEGIGGKISAFKSAWTAGAKKKRIFGSIGEVATATAATATAAAPILVKAVSFLKSIGIEPDELVQLGKDAINRKSQELAKKYLEPQASTQAADMTLAEQAMNETEKPKMNILPLIIAGGAVVYFVTNKK